MLLLVLQLLAKQHLALVAVLIPGEWVLEVNRREAEVGLRVVRLDLLRVAANFGAPD
ncbi:MAG: hypothetical protein ACJAYU_002294 [Bradymonadia bacterium]